MVRSSSSHEAYGPIGDEDNGKETTYQAYRCFYICNRAPQALTPPVRQTQPQVNAPCRAHQWWTPHTPKNAFASSRPWQLHEGMADAIMHHNSVGENNLHNPCNLIMNHDRIMLKPVFRLQGEPLEIDGRPVTICGKTKTHSHLPCTFRKECNAEKDAAGQTHLTAMLASQLAAFYLGNVCLSF